MKRFALCLVVAAAAPFAAAQTPVAWPKPVSSAQDAKTDRLAILNEEREAINRKLTDAVMALSKSTDVQASLKDVTRLQGDLAAIDREISNAEGRRSKGGAPAEARKPAAQAVGGGVTPAQSQLAGAQDDREYEAWDVFKNFGKGK